MATEGKQKQQEKQDGGKQANPLQVPLQKAEDSPVVQKGAKPLAAFFKKFSNDWTMNLQAGALAYNLILAFFPIIIAILSIFGLVLGGLSHDAQNSVFNALGQILPGQNGVSNGVLQQIRDKLPNVASFLGIIALVSAIFAGSRLFILIENCFDLIYHQRPRGFLKQNAMAIGMLVLFAILIPIMVFASSGPALLLSNLQNSFLKDIPGGNIIGSIIGIVGSFIVSWILFEAIYIIVPNQHISFKDSWRGAVIAALLLQVYLTLFPFYATHFLTGYVGQAGFAIILIVFFYYFAVILLLGAEINAFFAEGVRDTPDNLAGIVHTKTGHDPKPENQQEQQAPPTHKDGPPPNDKQ